MSHALTSWSTTAETPASPLSSGLLINTMPDFEFTVDTNTGRIAPARQIASPNFDARPAGTEIDLLIIHGISLPPGQFGTVPPGIVGPGWRWSGGEEVDDDHHS